MTSFLILEVVSDSICPTSFNEFSRTLPISRSVLGWFKRVMLLMILLKGDKSEIFIAVVRRRGVHCLSLFVHVYLCTKFAILKRVEYSIFCTFLRIVT